MPQSPSPSSLDQVRQALRRAFQLGQTYWMHADSESLIQHQKADVVQARFDALVEETCAALQQQEAGSLSDERILHLWDTHVGEPSAKLPLNDKDKLRFARAVLAACAPSPTEPADGVKEGGNG